MSWFLEQVSIEGFRGINNAGAPLELRFDSEKVNSVFASNGVGKSSIFEAVTYALRGTIPKLDSLPAKEGAPTYYLNRFHPGKIGTVSLTLKPSAGGPSVIITVTRNQHGSRTVVASDGRDGNALLAELNREFALLDAKTFQDFISEKPLERGRSFSGLLGLGAYSTLRQSIQALSNTRSFNNHFNVTAKTSKSQLLLQQITQAKIEIRASYLALTGEEVVLGATNDQVRQRAHATLLGIPLLQQECEAKSFDDISIEACLAKVRAAEGGQDRERLSQLLQAETNWREQISSIPSDGVTDALVTLAGARDAALEKTKGDIFRRLYVLTEQIVSRDDWQDKKTCPACERSGDGSVAEFSHAKIALYEAVSNIAEQIIGVSGSVEWEKFFTVENATKSDEDEQLIANIAAKLNDGTLNEVEAIDLQTRVATTRSRAVDALAAVTAEKLELEAKLPPSLVATTEKVEAARRLQSALKKEEGTSVELKSNSDELKRIERIRSYLASAGSIFSQAEGEASARRLAAVEPLCREYFGNIMFSPVVPAISKTAIGEELQISLADFYGLQNVSAQSLLSESYRNAFAISVYLAAASLYGGSARFLLLDDVTSSLDAGHQFHLMEVIRTKFSRPENTKGPQVIILSHDTLLEKYFNVNGSTQGWAHQRIEGTPVTEILPQANAVNRVYQATMTLLKAGNSQDAAPRIRQYLEYTLEEIIVRCRIPVPMDIALSDDKRMAGYLIGAIEAQVKLHASAKSLVLEQAQLSSLSLAVATISANFLAHWSTGQTQAFSPSALLGVMQAIENYAGCFKFEPTPGAGRRYYRSLSQKQ